jgi:hypothetical protein
MSRSQEQCLLLVLRAKCDVGMNHIFQRLYGSFLLAEKETTNCGARAVGSNNQRSCLCCSVGKGGGDGVVGVVVNVCQ